MITPRDNSVLVDGRLTQIAKDGVLPGQHEFLHLEVVVSCNTRLLCQIWVLHKNPSNVKTFLLCKDHKIRQNFIVSIGRDHGDDFAFFDVARVVAGLKVITD